MADRPRCSNCRRRVPRSGCMTVLKDGVSSAYCSRKPACRRAAHERHNGPVPISGASTEALGAALIAADYVRWPLWARLLPQRAKDVLRREFAWTLAAAVARTVESRSAPATAKAGESA